MKEIVQINVGVIPTFLISPTKYKIFLDNKLLFQSNGTFLSGQPQHHQFDVELDPGTHQLDIRIDPTNQQPETIQIIEIAFNNKKFTDVELFLMSKYLLDEPRSIDGIFTNKVDQCTHIGWAGVYRVSFTTPILLWLIRNL